MQEMQKMQDRSLGWEDLLEKEMAYPLQYSCLENPMDRGAWWAMVHGVAELDMTEQLTVHVSFRGLGFRFPFLQNEKY